MALARCYKILILWAAVAVGIFALTACGKSSSPKSKSSSGTPATVQPQLLNPAADDAGVTPQPAAPSNEPVHVTIRHDNIKRSMMRERDLTPMRVGSSDAPLGGFVFTGGSTQDAIVSDLQQRLASVPSIQQRDADLAFAREIGLVQVHYDGRNPNVLVTALLQRNGQRLFYDFNGYMNTDFSAEVGNAAVSPRITANVQCLDLNGGCRTMRVRFTDHAQRSGIRVAYVVVRQTPVPHMVIKSKMPEESNNPEFRRFATILYNTVRYSCIANTVCGITLNTSETVNGTSTFILGMNMLVHGPQSQLIAEQQLVWTGPLVQASDLSPIRLAVSQTGPAPDTRTALPVVGTDIPFMSDMLAQSLLTGNDGNGTLELKLTVRANKPIFDEETVTLVLKREQRPVRLLGL